MLARLWRLLPLLFCCYVVSDAKVINTEADSPYLLKVYTGVSQGIHWLWQLLVPDKPPRPPKTVELAIVGLGRTGSTSLTVALKELGYTPIHDDEAAEVSDIYGAMMRHTMSMDRVNAELGARGFDTPMISTKEYVKWAATAPNVKVILTMRDKKKWAQSWLSVVPVVDIIDQRPFKWVKAMQNLAEFQREIMVNVPTNGHPERATDIPTLEAGFDAWTAYVRKTVPADRLLEFNVKDGWGPLCEFLEKSIPSTPFPHINDRVVVDTIIKVFVLVTWIWPLFLALPLLLHCCCIACCARRDKTDQKKRD
eukprot:TRINITY_DN55933_c0_g1_i1.p1 TRINITY_DN55933_c0_g1~~TRINITY_DN55933_c0_g1_i1.p1  ORF type:complete len:321 (+),score=42.29 TRINITY_DN55933_c0_g1_i1:39-965(+)